MSRHRNIRNFVDDDFDTYDDAMPSSYDDDYSLTPTDHCMNFNAVGVNNVPVSNDMRNKLNFDEADFELQASQPVNKSDANGRNDAEIFDFPQEQFTTPICRKVQPSPKPTPTSVQTTPRPNHSEQFDSRSVQSSPARPPAPIDRSGLKKIHTSMTQQSNGKHILNLIVVGHVDAGKSTLMGNLLCQLGHVSDKQLSKFQWEAQKTGKSSFAFAWVLDQTSEERERGVTMDIAQTSFETESKKIILLDAPGHKDYVPQVIGGACQADCAVLVINSTRGEFETGFDDGNWGQTREHARLIRLLGIVRVIVAVNKLDTEQWSQARFEEIKTKLTSFFRALNMVSVQFCPVSGLYGVNLTPKSTSWSKTRNAQSSESDITKLAPWYNGPSLTELIDELPFPDRQVDGPFRFVVTDLFKPLGSSLSAVVGRVISGGVTAGVNIPTSRILCQPSGHTAVVKSIKSLSSNSDSNIEGRLDDSSGGANLLNNAVPAAFAGDQVALMLQGIEPIASLAPGDVIVDPDSALPITTRIRTKLLVFTVEQPITKGYNCIMYYQCLSLSVTISKLLSCTERKNKSEHTVQKPRFLMSNCTAEVEIRLERPMCMEVYERCKALGRFMLRNNGRSIAGGTVTAIFPMMNKVASSSSFIAD